MTSLVDKVILHLKAVVRRIISTIFNLIPLSHQINLILITLSGKLVLLRNILPLVVQDSWGPIARDMDTIVPVVKALLDGVTINKMDPLTVPYPFNDKVGKYHSCFFK